jgi:MYXO-CTERM domain-containing protein
MATDEYGCCSWYISEEVYVNGNLIGGNTQVGLYGAPNQTFKVTENTPFDLQLQLQFVSDGVYPYGDFGSYVVASLVDAPPQPVPGPEVGAGLPGLLGLLGLWWYRRQRDATRLISPAEWSR